MSRRFPLPWQVIEHAESFEVQDANGQPLSFTYFEDEDGRRNAMKRLPRDEARRIALNIAKLPDLFAAAGMNDQATLTSPAFSMASTIDASSMYGSSPSSQTSVVVS